jgi:hypothetical protein
MNDKKNGAGAGATADPPPILTLKLKKAARGSTALHLARFERGDMSNARAPVFMWQELEAEVLDDSDEELPQVGFQRKRRHIRAKERRQLWHIEDSIARAASASHGGAATAQGVSFDGVPESQSSVCVLLEEDGTNREIIVHSVGERLVFRRPIPYETITSKKAAELFESKVRAGPAMSAKDRLAKRFETAEGNDEEAKPRARAGGRASRASAAQNNPHDDDGPGESAQSHGLGDAGDDLDAAEVSEGGTRGVGLTVHRSCPCRAAKVTKCVFLAARGSMESETKASISRRTFRMMTTAQLIRLVRQSRFRFEINQSPTQSDRAPCCHVSCSVVCRLISRRARR